MIGPRWERKFANVKGWTRILDTLRWGLILAVWFLVAITLWNIKWFWAVIWVVPGLVITVNLVGFVTLPFYFLVNRLFGPKVDDFLREVEEGEKSKSS